MSGEISTDEMFSSQPMFTLCGFIGLANAGGPSTHSLHADLI